MKFFSELVLDLVELLQGLKLCVYVVVQVHSFEEGNAEGLRVRPEVVKHLPQHLVLLRRQLLVFFQDFVESRALLMELQEDVLHVEEGLQVGLQRRNKVEVDVGEDLIYVVDFGLLVRFHLVQLLGLFQQLVHFLDLGVVHDPLHDRNVLPRLTRLDLLRLLLLHFLLHL